ncbi:hypothetical protein WR25_04838 [Diploscapter pachys]|uniref:Uncharacterized protein n=1 Tax=Diploscapter pachys TaxID=2018661 RepID=A0A2A2M5P4_9BILA|nr:hypothetical protein WR25_04838 [Diploscapter pachys]
MPLPSSSSILASIATPARRFSATKPSTPDSGTRWTVMFSSASPPPSPVRVRPVASTSVKLSDVMPGEEKYSPRSSTNWA